MLYLQGFYSLNSLLNMNSSESFVGTKSFDLLPDELLHLILAQRLFVDYDMFSHRSPAQLLARRAEATSLFLVCRRWRRVVVPIVHETVILTSESEVNTFVSMLRHVGPYIKKLRIEGGYGRPIHTILSNIPRLAFICVSLSIPSKSKAGGLCRGLKLINPTHVVLRDSKVLGNQGVSNVVDVLIECMTSVWSNLVGVPLDMFCFPHSSNQVSYDHPYDEHFRLWIDLMSNAYQYRARRTRAAALARALARIPKLQTVYVPRAYFVPENDVVLSAIKNRSLQRIYGRINWISNVSDFEAALKTYPRLREVVHFPLPGPWTSPVYVAVGDRD
jgi:hypothetical protein